MENKNGDSFLISILLKTKRIKSDESSCDNQSRRSKAFLQDFIDEVEKGNIKLNIDSVLGLDQIVEAHQYMEDNKAKGKIVVTT